MLGTAPCHHTLLVLLVRCSNNMVCSVAFNRDDEYFATAGVSKRIRIYELAGEHTPCAPVQAGACLQVCLQDQANQHQSMPCVATTPAGVVSGAPVGGAYPVLEISSRSRLSSVCWSSYIQVRWCMCNLVVAQQSCSNL
jgi:hypothetical protein